MISVVIPAYNEEKTVAACLAALENQAYPRDGYEIILVNNNSTDRTRQIASQFTHVRVVDEPHQGYVHALKRGVDQSRGDIVLFTDADTVVPSEWVLRYARAYRDPGVSCAGGPGVFAPRTRQTALIEPIMNFGCSVVRLSNGFNMSVRKSVYQKFGGFRPDINFNADAYMLKSAQRFGAFAFLKDNPVVTSNRRYSNTQSIGYLAKSAINLAMMSLAGRTVFYEFGDVRDTRDVT